jgi:hypothetical protein
VPQHAIQTRQAEIGKLRGRDCAGGSDRGLDAHPFYSQFLVGVAFKPELEFLFPVSGKGEVGVGVDKTREGGESPAVYFGSPVNETKTGSEVGFRADKHNLSLEGGYGSIIKNSDIFKIRTPFGQRSAAGHDLTAVGDEEVS